MRTDCASASSFAWWRRMVRSAMPTTVADLPEGDSLIYLITVGGKFSIFLMSTANFIERQIAGLKPDVALIASIFYKEIHDFNLELEDNAFGNFLDIGRASRNVGNELPDLNELPGAQVQHRLPSVTRDAPPRKDVEKRHRNADAAGALSGLHGFSVILTCAQGFCDVSVEAGLKGAGHGGPHIGGHDLIPLNTAAGESLSGAACRRPGNTLAWSVVSDVPRRAALLQSQAPRQTFAGRLYGEADETQCPSGS